MTLVPYIGFIVIALLAVGFGTLALWKSKSQGMALLAAAIGLFVLGVGGGTYWMVGRPGLAMRQAQGLATRDINGLVPFLIQRVRKEPGDMQAWIYLARSYMTVGDARDAAAAYGRAVTLARLNHAESVDLDTAYGEAATAAAGMVSDEAEAAFKAALALDPKDAAARFFLGQARAEHNDRNGALAYWQSLLNDIPANAALHQTLVDRIALLTAQGAGAPGGAGAPDPRAMVAMLAARLKADPHDAAGWERLIRAYTVLGQTDDAKTALDTARKTFSNDREAMARLEAEAAELKLN